MYTEPPPLQHPLTCWQLTRDDGTDLKPELAHFAAMTGLERTAPGRISTLLLLQLYAGATSGTVNPAKVIHEIAGLEGAGPASQLKPPSRFERNPALRGLWHKHYLQDGLASMARNVQRGIRRHGVPILQKMVDEAAAAGEVRYFEAAHAAAIADDAVRGTWERLQEAQALTGEWIIFGVHDGANYYLSLGAHKEGDDTLRKQIEVFCAREFPFIASQLEPIPASDGAT